MARNGDLPQVRSIRVEFPSAKGEADEVKDEAAKGEGRLTAFHVAPAKARMMLRVPFVIEEKTGKLIPDPMGAEAQIIAHTPLVLRLNKWAVPRYIRIWNWTQRSDGFSMMGGPLGRAVIPANEARK